MREYWDKIKEFFKKHPYGAGGAIIAVVGLIYYLVSSSTSSTDTSITPQSDGTLTGVPVDSSGSGTATVDNGALQSLQDQLANSQNVNDMLQREMQAQNLANQSAMQQPGIGDYLGVAAQTSMMSAVTNGAKNLFGGLFGGGSSGAATATVLNPTAQMTSDWSLANGGVAPTFQNGGLQAIQSQYFENPSAFGSTIPASTYDPGAYVTHLSAGTTGTYDLQQVGGLPTSATNGVQVGQIQGPSAASTTATGFHGASVGVDALGVLAWDKYGKASSPTQVTGHTNTANAALGYLVTGNPVVAVAAAAVNTIARTFKRIFHW